MLSHLKKVTSISSKGINKKLSLSTSIKRNSTNGFKCVRLYTTEASEMDIFELYNPEGITTAQYKKNQLKKWRAQREEKDLAAKQSGFKVDWNYKMSHIIERPYIVDSVEEPWQKEYDEWRKRWYEPINAQIPDFTQLLQEESTSRREDEDEEQEFKYYEPGPLITRHDKMDNRKSLRRKLDQRLFLLVKKQRNTHAWQFPQGPLPLYETFEENVTPELRDVAQSQVDKVVGPKAHIYMSGNAPFGVYSYAYPKEYQKEIDTYGAKLFFFYGFYVKGKVSLSEKYEDHVWVTKEEMEEYIQDKALYRYLQKILP